MLPEQTRGSFGFLAPTVLPLPSAACRQDSPGGHPGPPPSGSLQPLSVRKRREEAGEGAARAPPEPVLYSGGAPPGRRGAVGGCAPQHRGPGHTETPSASSGREWEQQILRLRRGLKQVGPHTAPCEGLQGCSASWGQSIFVQRLFLPLPLRCATGRDKHAKRPDNTPGRPVLAQLPGAGPRRPWHANGAELNTSEVTPALPELQKNQLWPLSISRGCSGDPPQPCEVIGGCLLPHAARSLPHCCPLPRGELGRNQPEPQMPQLGGHGAPAVGARPWGAEGLSSGEGEPQPIA